MNNGINPIQLVQQFRQFQASFRGNPEQEAQKLLASGRINQQQLNQLQMMARQLQSMLK